MRWVVTNWFFFVKCCFFVVVVGGGGGGGGGEGKGIFWRHKYLFNPGKMSFSSLFNGSISIFSPRGLQRQPRWADAAADLHSGGLRDEVIIFQHASYCRWMVFEAKIGLVFIRQHLSWKMQWEYWAGQGLWTSALHLWGFGWKLLLSEWFIVIRISGVKMQRRLPSARIWAEAATGSLGDSWPPWAE